MRAETLPGYAGAGACTASGENADSCAPAAIPAASGHAENAQLDLCFERAPSGKTWLSRQRGGYPFHVGRILPVTRRADRATSSDVTAEVIVQSSSGGLFEDDRVFQRFVAMPRAQAAIRTAAATIVHTMTHGAAHSRVAIEAHPQSRFDYLPQPTILFPAARLVSTIDVVLHSGATVLIADTWLTHDPTRRAAAFGMLDATINIRNADAQLLARDRFRLAPCASRGSLSGVRQMYGAHGGLLVLRLGGDGDGEAGNEALAHAINTALQALDMPLTAAYAAAGVLPGACGTFVRMLGADSVALRAIFSTAVEAVHRTLDGVHEGTPRASHSSQNRNREVCP
ncbi:urease accessory protein UreD [Paraburkholderia caffeinilytica]|uniref:urease accessory protein UreD n=1 Tax=Paraburkholderia caffeinilytica TaxID=1761016 RepID=UPI003DA06D27